MNHKKQKAIHAPLGFSVGKQIDMKNGFTFFVEDKGDISANRKVTDSYWYCNDKFDYLLSSQLENESLGRQRQIKCIKSNKGKNLPLSKLSRYFSLDKGFYSFSDLFDDFLTQHEGFDITRIRSIYNKTKEHDVKHLIRHTRKSGAGNPTIYSYLPSIKKEDAQYFAFYLTHKELIDCYYKNKKEKQC